MNFLWPSKLYTGGTGNIWWWNNYDVFLIVLGVIILNSLILAFGNLTKTQAKKVTTTVFLVGSMLVLFQIKTRNFDFNYFGHTKKYSYYEQKSKEIQKRILGNRVFGLMEWFDKKLPVYF